MDGHQMWQILYDANAPETRPGLKMLAMSQVNVYAFGDTLYARGNVTGAWQKFVGVKGQAPDTQLNYVGLAGSDDAIFVHGGCTELGEGSTSCNKFSSDFHRFNISQKVWEAVSTKGDSPGARAFHAVTATGGYLYLHGGLDEGE